MDDHMNTQKILILTGGARSKLDEFDRASRELSMAVDTASFSDIEYDSVATAGEFTLRIHGKDIADYDLIYFRVVGKRLENASIVATYANQNGVKVVDRLYSTQKLLPSSLVKGVETKMLIEAGIPLPKTYYAKLSTLAEKAESKVGFPFVLKGTTGKKAREVWSPKTKEELDELVLKLREEEKSGKNFFAQEFVAASERIRVFIIGNRVVSAIVRPTKWRKRFTEADSEDSKRTLDPIPQDVAELALAATKALMVDISGVDIVVDDVTKAMYILEVNAAPSWKLIKKDTGMDVEKEILKYLATYE
jgi:RimK family alpha-L-glutamate ligase